MACTFMRPDWTVQITPYLIDGSLAAKQAMDYAILYNTILNLPDLLCEGDAGAFAQRVGFRDPSQHAVLAQTARHDGMFPCRWDVMVQNGQWHAMEANFGGALGGLPSDPMQELYDRFQAQTGAQTDDWLSGGHAIASKLRILSADLDNPAFVVVDDAEQFASSPLTATSAAQMLGQHLGCSVTAIPHTKLPAFVQQCGHPVVTFEMFTLRDIADDPTYQYYLDACRDQVIRRGVSLWCDLFMSKTILALLHQVRTANLVSAEIAEIIQRAVPHTVVITHENLTKLKVLPRHDYVLKGAIGHGGNAVFCGWETDADTWADMFDDAVDPMGSLGQCVLQKRVNGTPSTSISMTPSGLWIESDAPQVLGVFQVDGTFCGGGVRQSVAGSGVVNASRMASAGVLRLTPVMSKPALNRNI